jgi:hypothetical protein
MGSGLIDQVASGEAPPLVPITVEQLHRMLEEGIIRDGDPVELLEGLLVRKNRAAAGEGEMTHGARRVRAAHGLPNGAVGTSAVGRRQRTSPGG